MMLNRIFISGVIMLFLGTTITSYGQTDPQADSLAIQDSLRLLEEADELNKPLGDTTAVYYYWPQRPQQLYTLDTSLNEMGYPSWRWRQQEQGIDEHLGHIGTPLFPLLWAPAPKAGFRTGLDAFAPYRLHARDVKYYKIGQQRPYTSLRYSQINLRNALIRATFAHEVNPYFSYNIQYQLLNYVGYFQGHRSRHQNISVNFHYQKNKYGFYFNIINNATNQSENGGVVDTALINEATLFLNNVSVNLNPASNGSPKNENRHQQFSYRHYWQNKEADSTGKSTAPTVELSHHLNLENYRYKYFDSNPPADSVVYGVYQTNNRGVRHYMLHTLVKNELSYKQALGGSLQKSPLVFRAYVQHVWNRVNQEPDILYVNNFVGGLEIYDALQGDISYEAQGQAVNSRLGLDFWLKGQLKYALKNWIEIKGKALFQRYEPAQIARQIYVSTVQLWDNPALRQTQEASIYGTLAWPVAWGSLQVANHTITNPIFYDEQAVVQQFSGTANILQLRLKQDLHLWKFHLKNDVSWQPVLAGDSIFRLPEFILQHQFYFESRVFTTTQLRIGANLRYITGFRPNSYQPVIGQFHLQQNQQLSFYPVADVFVSAKIWQARFFVNAENLTYFLFNNANYYTAPNYPRPNWFVRMGVSWQLFD